MLTTTTTHLENPEGNTQALCRIAAFKSVVHPQNMGLVPRVSNDAMDRLPLAIFEAVRLVLQQSG